MDTSHSPIRILLADTRTLFRVGLHRLLDQESDLRVVGEAADGTEATRLAHELNPDILLIDLHMLGTPEAPVLKRLSLNGHRIHTLVLAGTSGNDKIGEALRMGARGYVLKESETAVLVNGIHSVMRGKFWLGHEAASRPANGAGQELPGSGSEPPARMFGLTRRELQIVAAVVSGYSNREIAQKFSISEDTVKHHVTNIFDKVGVYNRLELALFAVHHRLTGTRDHE